MSEPVIFTSKVRSKVVGIDVSLRSTGIVLYDVHEKAILETHIITLPSGESIDYTYPDYVFYRNFVEDKFRPILEDLEDELEDVLFVVEGVSLAGKIKTSLKIHIARMIYFDLIREVGKGREKVCSPTVQTWKKDLAGKLNATKEETLKLLQTSFSHVKGLTGALAHVDTMDAAALAIWGSLHDKTCKATRTKKSKRTTSKKRRKRAARKRS